MPTYISLINWTEKGAAGLQDTVDRAGRQQGARRELRRGLKEIYWTLGLYDIVAVSEAPDDERARLRSR
jgi:uncharacterized protein with GYD domain